MPSTESTPEPLRQQSSLDCEEATRLIRAFATGEIDHDSTRSMRSHLSTCSACMQSYRGAVKTTASLGRFTLEEREKRQIERQRIAQHAQAFGAREVPQSKRRWFRLRMVAIPAVVIYLITQIANIGPQPGRVELIAHEGHVTIDGRSIEGLNYEPLVLPGRWIFAGQFSKARLDGRKCVIDVESETALLLESSRPVRFRLRNGSVRVEGNVTFITLLGLLEVTAGKGFIYFGEGGWQIDPEVGTWTLFDKRGEHLLEPGTRNNFRP